MRRAKKILNDPANVVPELLEGLAAAYGGYVRLLEPTGAVVKAALPPDRVGVLFGGGSGHEPLFARLRRREPGRRRRLRQRLRRAHARTSSWRRRRRSTAAAASSTSTATTPATT